MTSGVLRCIVFTSNFLVFLSGLALLTVSLVVKFTPSYKDSLMDNDTFRGVMENDDKLDSALIGSAVLGGLIFLFAFLACCGALMENSYLLGAYLMLLSIMVTCQLALGILGVVMKDKLIEELGDKVRKIFDKKTANTVITCEDIQRIQDKLECCGGHGQPVGRCSPSSGGVDYVDCQREFIGKACPEAVEHLLSNHVVPFFAIVFGFIAFQVLSIVVVSILCHSIVN